MTTSTNENSENELNQNGEPDTISGALADALTIIRVLLTPIIMLVIYLAWKPKTADINAVASVNLKLILLASILFILAAITDILDDYIGGSVSSNERHFGWIDDIADSLLISGSLLALLWAFGNAKILHWSFAIPVFLYVARDLIVGLKKGYEISKYGFLETRLGDIKSALAMLATCTLIATPWLSNLLLRLKANNSENLIEIYGQGTRFVWYFGLGLLWIAAILSLWTGYKIMTTNFEKMAKEQEKQLKKEQSKLAKMEANNDTKT